MLNYIFLILLGSFLLSMFIFINNRDLASRFLKRFIVIKPRGKIRNFYMAHFREHRESRLKRNIIYQMFPWLLIIGLIFFLGNQYIFFGTVVSGSMEPTFKRGDLVLMQSMNKEPYVGDIVMINIYKYKEPITHRISSVEKDKIKTKGDNNPKQDPWTAPKSSIIGKAIVVGKKPVVIQGLGGILVPEAAKFSILTKLTGDLTARILFNKLRSMQPLIILFLTVFYFLSLIETRNQEGKRFGRKHETGIRKTTGDKSE